MTYGIHTPLTSSYRKVYILAAWNESTGEWDSPCSDEYRKRLGYKLFSAKTLSGLYGDMMCMRFKTRKAAMEALRNLNLGN